MKSRSRSTSGLLLILVLASAGMLLIFVPSLVATQYQRARALGHPWDYVYIGVVGSGAVLVMGSLLWTSVRLFRNTRRKKLRKNRQNLEPSQLTAEQKQREIRENLKSVEDLRCDPAVAAELRDQLKPLVDRIEQKRQSQRLEIVAFGTVSSGKSSLLNSLAGRDLFSTDARGGTTMVRNEVPWPGNDRVTLVDTPGLGEVDGAERQQVTANAAKDADLVLLVVDGPLRDSEFTLLERLAEMEKRVIVCLNKEDWYDSRQRDLLLGQLSRQLAKFVPSEDVIAVRSRPAQRQRTRVLADHSRIEETVPISPDIERLADRMMSIIRHDGSELLLANLLLQSRGLVDEARARVQAALDRRAWQIVDKYTWGAGGAAALSPFPVIDLAAGCAVSTKMVLDLARVYRQDVDVDTAVQLLGQQGKNLLAVLGTSAATPAVASIVASLIKTVPGIGTVAGGMMQGLVQALVTRWIGAVFIRYFKAEMREPVGGMSGLARREWQRMTTISELRKLVQAARARFSEEADS